MTPDRENKKGGNRLPRDQERPRTPAKQKLTNKQKAMRVIYITVTIIAALVVVAFAVSRLLFVKPQVQTVPERTRPPQASGSLPVDDSEAPDTADSGRKPDYYTFLVAGRDTGGGGNTDVVMVVSYDVPNQRLNVMNMPRDTMVNKSWDIKKLNSVYNYGGGKNGGGIEALKETVGDTVGFTPDFYVIVEWEAVGRLATAIGGVEFDVPLNMNYDDPTQDLHIHVNKGLQQLNGEQVMQVLRFRKNNNGTGYATGDIGRIETQQKLLMAIAQKLLQPSIATKIPELVNIFFENVETDLTIPNLLWFGKAAVGGLSPDNVSFVTMPGNYGGYFWSREIEHNESYVFPYADEIVELVNADFNPYLRDVSKADLDIMYKNKDGTIASTSGVLRDSKANPAYWAHVNAAAATPKPNTSEPPEDTDPPEVTETPGPSAEPSPGVTPAPSQSVATPTPPPAETPAATVSPEPVPDPVVSQPLPTSTPAPAATPEPPPAPTPAPDTGDQEGPPEGIPIL